MRNGTSGEETGFEVFRILVSKDLQIPVPSRKNKNKLEFALQ